MVLVCGKQVRICPVSWNCGQSLDLGALSRAASSGENGERLSEHTARAAIAWRWYQRNWRSRAALFSLVTFSFEQPKESYIWFEVSSFFRLPRRINHAVLSNPGLAMNPNFWRARYPNNSPFYSWIRPYCFLQPCLKGAACILAVTVRD